MSSASKPAKSKQLCRRDGGCALADDLSLPVIYDFEDGKVPDAFNLTNQNAKVAVSVVDKGEGKVLQIALAAQTMWLAGRVNFDITTGTLPAGLYRISVDFAAEEYPDSGLEFYIYSRTKTGGKARFHEADRRKSALP